MTRLPRYVIPGQPQHIILRGNNRQAIFAAEADFQFFRDAMVSSAEKHGLLVHAYVWMTNHIHLLATPELQNSISKVFQSVGGKYVQYSTTLNPVRAGMVEHPVDYPWSSYAFNAQGESGANSDWLSPHEEYLRLESNPMARQGAYRQLFEVAISDINMNEIRECTHKGWALGSERFREQIETLGQRRASSKDVGRPRKADNRG